ncbi:alpha/beta fold hydrolase [Streptomyces sp. NPDC000987]|uniref:alpha/beta fold hydrolase n=1 Tax=Streptomyces sp. NPDC000987 TaxID=3154374 RepID=UPI0033289536
MTELHYDVRGHGPVLLIVPGGSGHPMGLGPLVDALAGRFTVVTYDPLGLAHGRLGQPVADQRVEDWSDGAHRVLEETLTEGEPGYVLGMSSGAVAALDLLARHPHRLRHVIAHEPPCVGVLPDGDRQLPLFGDVYATYRAAGLAAAAARLTAGLTGAAPPDAGPARPLTREQELAEPMALFVVHVLRRFAAHEPDLDALAAAAGRLTLAAGSDSRGQLLHRTAGFLAERTGSGLAELPGGHLGALQHPAAFAERIAATLPPLGTPGAPMAT